MKCGIHQPNLASWFPFFWKMEHSDIFVVMINCQFEKNGYQNRANIGDKWWTVPVTSGKVDIKDKKYCNGISLVDANMHLILGWAKILGIDTSKVHFDFPTTKTGTDRLIEICKRFECDEYLTNSDSTDKYLDEKKMNDNYIEVVKYDIPKQFKKSIYDMFNESGVEMVQKLIKRDFIKCRA